MDALVASRCDTTSRMMSFGVKKILPDRMLYLPPPIVEVSKKPVHALQPGASKEPRGLRQRMETGSHCFRGDLPNTDAFC